MAAEATIIKSVSWGKINVIGEAANSLITETNADELKGELPDKENVHHILIRQIIKTRFDSAKLVWILPAEDGSYWLYITGLGSSYH